MPEAFEAGTPNLIFEQHKMTDPFDNPMGLMGFEFVEFASPTPDTRSEAARARAMDRRYCGESSEVRR